MKSAQALFSASAAEVDEHAQAIVAGLRSTGTGAMPSLARWFRDRRAHRRLQLSGVNLDVTQLDTILEAVRPELRTGVAAVASMVRNGWTRERAVVVLNDTTTDLSVAALLIRLDDPVATIADRAWQALVAKLDEPNIGAVGACLPVIDRLGRYARVQRYPALRVIRELMTGTSQGLTLLWQAASDSDSSTRFVACRWLAERYAGGAEVRRVLELALGDHNPRTRLWATQLIANKKVTPAEARLGLVRLLELDSAPPLRLAALRLRDRQGDLAALERAALDSNANVRFFARKFLARKSARVDLRQRALDRLHAAQSSTRELVGALAALSEAGTAKDALVIRGFLDDPRPRVAREAQRTLAALPR